jgi:molecular chaperone DnaK
MSRTTIDFGIDLGTTNSAIAVLKGIVPEVVKNNLDNEITPSAVNISKRGDLQVGLRAKQRLEDDKTIDDTFIEFKRLMGAGKSYEFKSTARMMSAEELSAEVLKGLKGDVQQRLGEVVQSAVITVPAAFEQKQCIATKKAGELAGFAMCPLLQEPVAAALAYGFQADVTKEYWLIYDFGGGTFDAALMKAEDGTIVVTNHGGDNYLGGSDIDWAIIEKLILPQIKGQFNLPDFTRGNKDWRAAFAKIKAAAEAAKIELSRSDSAYLECKPFDDADGESVEIDLKLTRDALVSVAEPIILRSAGICQRVLKEKNLSPSAVEKMILVGGPTLAPYFREILHAALGIKLDHSIDPLTVVARGAAVFAGTQQISTHALPKVKAGEFTIDLKYKPVGPDEDPLVRGSVIAENGADTGGFVIEFVNEKTKWRSGRIPLKAEGKFRVNLIAEKGSQNVFLIELYDPQGTKQITIPDRIAYTIGTAMSEQPVINSIGVALANNGYDIFFKKGDALPAKVTKTHYRTAIPLKKGGTGEVLHIPVIEGESDKADRNRLQDSLTIKATDIKRDLPSGSEVEITLFMDASRIIRAKAYIPMLDEEFEAVIDPSKHKPDPVELKKELREEKKRLSQLQEKADDEEDTDLVEEQMDDLEEIVEAAGGDDVSANKAEARLLEVKIALDKLEDGLCMSTLAGEAHGALDELDGLVEAHGDDGQRQMAEKLREEVDELIEQKNADRLRKKIEQVGDLHREILFAQPAFWVAVFENTVEQKTRMTDQALAGRFIDQGRQCIQHGNVQGLRTAVRQLMDLLPRDVANEIQRGYGSGLLKG